MPFMCSLPWVWTIFDLQWNTWSDLDTSAFNRVTNQTPIPAPNVPLSHTDAALTCEAVHGKLHATDAFMTRLTILFLSVTFMCATHLVMAWSGLPKQVLLLFTHSLLSFNKSKPLKLKNKCGGILFPSAPLDAVYTLLRHDMSWQVGSLSQCSVKASGDSSTSFCTLPGKICSGAFQCGKQVFFFSSTVRCRGVLNMDLTWWWISLFLAILGLWMTMSVCCLVCPLWFRLKYLNISCMDWHKILSWWWQSWFPEDEPG